MHKTSGMIAFVKIIGIGGGSGAGKSAVSYALADRYPEIYEVINLDDYQKLSTAPNLPMLNEKINWDHPDILRWDVLINDIDLLKNGQPIEISTWAHRSNPDYAIHGNMTPRKIEPKPVMIVEGYLALYHNTLLKLYDKSFYLKLDEEVRNSRRDKNRVIKDDEYEADVLKPMFHEYVEPTRDQADVVIDILNKSIDEVCDEIEAELK